MNSQGDDGSVSQSNTSAALSASANKNKADQDIDQTQGCGCDRGGDPKRKGSDSESFQVAGQEAWNDQWARLGREREAVRREQREHPDPREQQGRQR